MKLPGISLREESTVALRFATRLFHPMGFTSRNYPTAENINKKIKSDEERHERGDVLETRQFGSVGRISLGFPH